MLNKLELIIGSKNAGNTSSMITNEGKSIIDNMLRRNILTDSEYKALKTKYF